MTKDTYRTIGALLGLGIGIGLMMALGMGGIIPAALFGAGGCVAGAVIAERLHAKNNRGN